MIAQAQLFTPADCPPPKRPAMTSPEVHERLVKRLAERFAAWNEEPLGEHAIASLRRATELWFIDSAYRMARNLDTDGWDVDDDVTEILSDAHGYGRMAHDAVVTEWVAKYDIRPPFPIGARVKCKVQRVEHVGEVTAIDAKRATYTVRVAALGHVAKGELGTHGFILNYEDVTPWTR